MLVSMKLLDTPYSSNVSFKLVDTDFTCISVVPRNPGRVTGAVVVEYHKRNLPVAKNVALAYLFYKTYNIDYMRDLLISGKKYMEKIYPEINYTNKYYPCVKRYLDYYLSLE